jgi:hypothetical protein
VPKPVRMSARATRVIHIRTSTHKGTRSAFAGHVPLLVLLEVCSEWLAVGNPCARGQHPMPRPDRSSKPQCRTGSWAHIIGPGLPNFPPDEESLYRIGQLAAGRTPGTVKMKSDYIADSTHLQDQIGHRGEPGTKEIVFAIWKHYRLLPGPEGEVPGFNPVQETVVLNVERHAKRQPRALYQPGATPQVMEIPAWRELPMCDKTRGAAPGWYRPRHWRFRWECTLRVQSRANASWHTTPWVPVPLGIH